MTDDPTMNGAQSLLRTLVDNGVDVCFTNPGTSEMHFVAALDGEPRMRAVLGLFEGVVTGAADGYARMTGRPAATLLHLGPGLGNGIANLHNARRAHTPMVNIVGDHATYHKPLDAPLESDIETLAAQRLGLDPPIRRTPTSSGADAADAVVAARTHPGEIATLILPADVSWTEGGRPGRPAAGRRHRSRPNADAHSTLAAKVLRSGEPAALLVGDDVVRDDSRRSRSSTRSPRPTGAKVLAEVFPTRVRRGAGIAAGRAARLSRRVRDRAARRAPPPRARRRRSRPSRSSPTPASPATSSPTAARSTCSPTGRDRARARSPRSPTTLGVDTSGARLAAASRPERPTGALTGPTLAAAVGAVLPEGAIVVDEAQTGGIWASPATAGCPPHDWLTLTGGAIGFGMPVATGAAVACPDRPVINLQADGSAMYTLQSLWTQAREGLDVTTVIFANRSYAILNLELSRVGVETPGPVAKSMLDLTRPELDFVALARGMGVPAERPDDAEGLTAALERAVAEPGPHLIEAVIPSGF